MLWNFVRRLQVKLLLIFFLNILRNALSFWTLIESQKLIFYFPEIFRDWSKNEYFNCTVNPEDNPSVERCGVPFSCCLSGSAHNVSGEPGNYLTQGHPEGGSLIPMDGLLFRLFLRKKAYFWLFLGK